MNWYFKIVRQLTTSQHRWVRRTTILLVLPVELLLAVTCQIKHLWFWWNITNEQLQQMREQQP